MSVAPKQLGLWGLPPVRWRAGLFHTTPGTATEAKLELQVWTARAGRWASVAALDPSDMHRLRELGVQGPESDAHAVYSISFLESHVSSLLELRDVSVQCVDVFSGDQLESRLQADRERQKKLPEFSPQAKCGGARRGLDGALETSDAPRSKAGVAPTKQPAQTTEPAVSKPGRPSSRGRLLVGALASKPSAAPCAAAVAPDDAAKPATANAAAAAATSSSPVVKLEHPAPPKAEATKSGEPYGAQRRAHDDLKRTLPLPDDYRRLQDSFVSLDTTLSFYRSRGEPAFFRPVCEAVQRSTSRAFSEATLRLLLGVWPEAFSVEAVAVAACRGRPATTDWLLGLPAPERQRGAATRSEERRAEFHTRLISLVRAEHDAWLQSLPPPTPEHASMSHERAWHPEFALNSCALPAEAELPDLSLVEAPPASRASQNAASVPRQTSRKTSEASSSDSATATLAEVAPPPAPATACVSSNAPEGCTGLSGSLIAKIKAKELAAQQDLATQAPIRRAHMLEQLPALARSVRKAMLTATGGGTPRLALPLADLVRLLQQNDSCSASVTELREQLELLAAEAPRGWYAHAETHRGISARVDNRQNFAQVVAALRALKALSPNANGAR